jgi:hypothetical protein
MLMKPVIREAVEHSSDKCRGEAWEALPNDSSHISDLFRRERKLEEATLVRARVGALPGKSAAVLKAKAVAGSENISGNIASRQRVSHLWLVTISVQRKPKR